MPAVSNHQLNETWIRASIMGTTWAASEIIFGSFLHNLRIPFSGNILTAVAIVMLIAFHKVWWDKWLILRAGLICALLKTISPSAIIFGPMVAIVAEALILEVVIRFLGRNTLGYLLAAALAMSWNLFQKIANLIIFYGWDIVRVYREFLNYAQKQLNTDQDLFWTPILVLGIIYIVFGLFAGLVGIHTGKSIDIKPPVAQNTAKKSSTGFQTKTNGGFDQHSLWWLFGNLFILIWLIILQERINFWIWATAVSITALIWVRRYRRATRQLRKPGLWISFFVITMLTAFLFSGSAINKSHYMAGIIMGLQMNLRAILVVLGFTVLGTEMYNPRIQYYLSRSRFNNLTAAVELSFESLPVVIESIPNFKKLLQSPVYVVRNLVLHARQRLEDFKKYVSPVIILKGAKNSGKTSFLEACLKMSEETELPYVAALTMKVFSGPEHMGYDLHLFPHREIIPLLRPVDANPTRKSIGKYQIIEGSFERATHYISDRIHSCQKPMVLIIDEVGRLELKNEGWHKLLESMQTDKIKLCLVCREEVVGQIRKKYGWELRVYDHTKVTPSDFLNNFIN